MPIRGEAGRDKAGQSDSRQGEVGGREGGDWRFRLVALVSGLALILLAVPRLIAAVEGLEGREVLWDSQGMPSGSSLPLTEDRLLAGADSLAAQTKWEESGEAESDRGLLLLRAANLSRDPVRHRDLLRQARVASEAGLALAPGQPSTWARLAALRLDEGDGAGAALALRLSLMSGPVVPPLMTSRLALALRLLPVLKEGDAELLRRQVRLAWVLDPDGVAALAEGKPQEGRAEGSHFVIESLNSLNASDMEAYIALHGKVQGKR